MEVEDIFDRFEEEVVETVRVDDGQVFKFPVNVLKRLVEDAEASPAKMAIVFVRRPSEAKS